MLFYFLMFALNCDFIAAILSVANNPHLHFYLKYIRFTITLIFDINEASLDGSLNLLMSSAKNLSHPHTSLDSHFYSDGAPCDVNASALGSNEIKFQCALFPIKRQLLDNYLKKEPKIIKNPCFLRGKRRLPQQYNKASSFFSPSPQSISLGPPQSSCFVLAAPEFFYITPWLIDAAWSLKSRHMLLDSLTNPCCSTLITAFWSL